MQSGMTYNPAWLYTVYIMLLTLGSSLSSHKGMVWHTTLREQDPFGFSIL